MKLFLAMFSTDGFNPRSTCGYWPGWLKTMHVFGDSIIAFSYLLIAMAFVCMLILLRKKRMESALFYHYRRILWIEFALFIFCCAVTHINQVVVWWYPSYRFFGIWTLITAVVSLVAACTLWWALGTSIKHIESTNVVSTA